MPYGQYGGGTVAVGVAPPTLLFAGSASGALIQNNGAVLVYIGGSTVTANTAATGGLTIAAGVTLSVPDTSATADGLYAVVASGTANVAWLAPG
jgi:hypothetical protein